MYSFLGQNENSVSNYFLILVQENLFPHTSKEYFSKVWFPFNRDVEQEEADYPETIEVHRNDQTNSRFSPSLPDETFSPSLQLSQSKVYKLTNNLEFLPKWVFKSYQSFLMISNVSVLTSLSRFILWFSFFKGSVKKSILGYKVQT